jgi:hypothetical protein
VVALSSFTLHIALLRFCLAFGDLFSLEVQCFDLTHVSQALHLNSGSPKPCKGHQRAHQGVTKALQQQKQL